MARPKTRRTLSEGGDTHLHSPTGDEEDTLKASLNGLTHSKRMHHELDETSKTLAQLMESLDTDFNKPSRGKAEEEEEEEAFQPGRDGEVVKRNPRSISAKALNRLGISSSLSTSEPGRPLINMWQLLVHGSNQ